MAIEYTAHSTERYRAPGPKRKPVDRQERRVFSAVALIVALWALVLFGGFYAVFNRSSGEPRSEPSPSVISIAAVATLSEPLETPTAYLSETPSPTLTPTSSPVPTETPTQVDCIPQVVEVEIIREITVEPDLTETPIPSPTETVSAFVLKANHDTEMIIRSENHKMSLIEFFVSPAFIVSALSSLALLITYATLKIAEIRRPTIETTIETGDQISERAIETNYPTRAEVDQIARALELLPELKEHPTYISKIWYDQRGGTGFYKVTKALKIIERRKLTPPPVEDVDLDPAFNV